ncbi:helix-turn-helix domain-containing protein [Streptomyces sp. NPDC088775]|uniref:helix-turn-helix domain-containing protein n=1 Tax=Streptomyces sp. NPDC088775 TaxID=3365896 RepID=UPI0038258399
MTSSGPRAVAVSAPNPKPPPAPLDLPVIKTGKNLTGSAREEFARKVVAAYRTPRDSGRRVTIREICEATGRSYGAIHSILSEAGATRHGPRAGGATGQVKS